MVRGAREIRAAFHGYDRFGFYRQTKTSPQSGLTRLIVLDDREEFGAGTRLEVDGAHPSNRSASAKTSVAWIGSHKPFLYSRYLRSTSSTHASSISSRTSPPNELGKRSARKARSCRGRFNAYLVLLFQARQTIVRSPRLSVYFVLEFVRESGLGSHSQRVFSCSSSLAIDSDNQDKANLCLEIAGKAASLKIRIQAVGPGNADLTQDMPVDCLFDRLAIECSLHRGARDVDGI